MTDSFCPHIIKAKEAIVKKQFAESKVVDVYEVLQLVSDEELEVQLLNASSDGEINIFSLPGKNIADNIGKLERSEHQSEILSEV